MKRFYVLEVAADNYFVRVLEVTQEFISKGVSYHRDASADAVVYGTPGPRFYGKLDALLITQAKLEAAAPIIPEYAQPVPVPSKEDGQ